MKLHPMLDDPQAVLIVRTPVPEKVAWDDFRRAAAQVMAAMALEVEGEAVVLKPNVTAGESYDNPDTGIITHAGFVQGLAEYLTAHGARRGGVYVLEDPRNHNDNAPRSWRNTGYPEMAQTTGAKLRTPTTCTCEAARAEPTLPCDDDGEPACSSPEGGADQRPQDEDAQPGHHNAVDEEPDGGGERL